MADDLVHLDPDKFVIVATLVVSALCLGRLASCLVDVTASLVVRTKVLGQDDDPQVQVPQVGCKTDEAQVQMDESVDLDTPDRDLKNEARSQATKDRCLKTAVRGKTDAALCKTNDVRGEMSTVLGHGNAPFVHLDAIGVQGDAIGVHLDAIGVRLDAVLVQVDARVFTMVEVPSRNANVHPKSTKSTFQTPKEAFMTKANR